MTKLKLLRAFFLILCIGSVMTAHETQVKAESTGKITGTVTDASD